MKTAVSSPAWRSWALPILWTLAIVSVSGNVGSPSNTVVAFKWVMSWVITLDPDTLTEFHFYTRKVLHLTCYGVLAVLWFRALMISHPDRFWTNSLLALALTLLVALSDEGHQYLAADRSSSLWDVGLDLSGGVLFLFLATCLWARKNRLPSGNQPPSP